MFDFSKFFEFIFKSFEIQGNSDLLKDLESDDKVRFVVLLKRHIIYWIFESWRVIIVVLIALVNVALLTVFTKSMDLISWIIAWVIWVSISYWTYIIIKYFINIYKINWNHPHIEDIFSAISKTEKTEKIFKKFFNQTIFLFLLMWLVTVFTVFMSAYHTFYVKDTDYWVGILNAALSLIQLVFFSSYLPKMINQEMDFRVVIPGKLVFSNQNGFLSNSQTMLSSKIKTINTDFKSFLWSFFNYWEVHILTEWDSGMEGKMILDYTWAPNDTVKEIEKVLYNNLQAIEDEVNILLQKLNHEIWIENVDTKENMDKLIKYVKQNEQKLKDLYETADDETKREIKQLYVLINK